MVTSSTNHCVELYDGLISLHQTSGVGTLQECNTIADYQNEDFDKRGVRKSIRWKAVPIPATLPENFSGWDILRVLRESHLKIDMEKIDQEMTKPKPPDIAKMLYEGMVDDSKKEIEEEILNINTVHDVVARFTVTCHPPEDDGERLYTLVQGDNALICYRQTLRAVQGQLSSILEDDMPNRDPEGVALLKRYLTDTGMYGVIAMINTCRRSGREADVVNYQQVLGELVETHLFKKKDDQKRSKPSS